MAERRLKNWLHSFLSWSLPRSESPESVILWTGLSTIASVVKRHVYFSKRMMGSYILFPHLYVLMVGKPGVIRKSTSIGYSEELLVQLEDVSISASAMSDSSLVETLSLTDDAAISIISSEFGTFMGVSKEAMYNLLTDLFDGKIKHDYSTRLHGLELALNPCINLLGATTPKWIASQPPDILMGGGFSSRVVFVYESRVRQRHMYYDHLTPEDYEALKDDLIHDLELISSLEGEFSHDSKDTRDLIEQWYLDTADLPVEDERVEGYFQRKPTHLHKLMMALSLAERDDLVITTAHFHQALAILESIEEKMPKALISPGRNPYADEIDKIREYVALSNGGIKKSKLLARFYNNLSPAALDDVLSALVVMGDLEAKKDEKDGKPIYRFIGKAGY